MTELLPYFEGYSQSPDKPVLGTMIWLHGLGASGADFEPILPYLRLDFNLRFILPNAPQRPVTINMGMIMPSWYDILSIGDVREVNMQQVASSVSAAEAFIQHEVERGVPTERIVLGGFSQGGAITLQTALRFEFKLAGIMALSTYLLELDKTPPAQGKANETTSILMHHGEQDPLIPLALAERSKEMLVKQGYRVQWQTYAMEHGLCEPQIQDIARWLRTIFKP